MQLWNSYRMLDSGGMLHVSPGPKMWILVSWGYVSGTEMEILVVWNHLWRHYGSSWWTKEKDPIEWIVATWLGYWVSIHLDASAAHSLYMTIDAAYIRTLVLSCIWEYKITRSHFFAFGSAKSEQATINVVMPHQHMNAVWFLYISVHSLLSVESGYFCPALAARVGLVFCGLYLSSRFRLPNLDYWMIYLAVIDYVLLHLVQ